MKENKIIVFYNEIEQRNKYRLNGVDVTDVIECLLENHEKEVVDSKCKLFQLDLTIHKILKDKLALTEKALELACKEITGSCEYCSYKTRVECPVEANCLDEKINYFKNQAKEMMKSE